MIDLHVHLLPGIDDGPRDWEDSMMLCRALAREGVTKAVATPHVIDGVFNNGRALVADLTAQLNDRLAAEAIDLDVLPGGEIDISSNRLFEEDDDLPLLGGSKAVLLEMPVAVIPSVLMETIFALKTQGLLPVLAHPERNELLQENLELARPWVDAGVALQLDGDSLLGLWGKRARRCSELLLRAGWIHAMASDAHSTDKRPPRVQAALAEAALVIGADAAPLFLAGPEAILAGRRPEGLYDVAPATSRRRAAKQAGWLGRLLGRRTRTKSAPGADR